MTLFANFKIYDHLRTVLMN